MMKDNNKEWNKSIIHTEEMPKGVEVEPNKTKWSKEDISKHIGSKNYNIVDLRLNNACLVFDKNSVGFVNITCTMMLMAFSDEKNQKIIYGNCLLTNRNYIQ